MYQLNEKLKSIKAYDPQTYDFKVRLDANESFFNIPDSIKDEICEKMKTLNFNRYPDPLSVDLCKCFADFYNIENNDIAVGNGSDEIISIILSSFLMKGDKYALFADDFSMYSFYGYINENLPVYIDKKADFSIDVNSLIDRCNEENVKLLIFSNPCNPTSLGIKAAKIEQLVKNVNCLVVIDEAYMDFWNESVLDKVHTYDNLIVLRTASKAIGIASLRVGFAVGSKTLIDVIKATKSPYNVNSFSQMVAAELYSNKDIIRSRINEIIKSRIELQNKLIELAGKYGDRIHVIDSCTNFVTVLSQQRNDIYNYLLTKGISIRKFDSYLRITAGNSFENEAVVSAVNEYLSDK